MPQLPPVSFIEDKQCFKNTQLKTICLNLTEQQRLRLNKVHSLMKATLDQNDDYSNVYAFEILHRLFCNIFTNPEQLGFRVINRAIPLLDETIFGIKADMRKMLLTIGFKELEEGTYMWLKEDFRMLQQSCFLIDYCLEPLKFRIMTPEQTQQYLKIKYANKRDKQTSPKSNNNNINFTKAAAAQSQNPNNDSLTMKQSTRGQYNSGKQSPHQLSDEENNSSVEEINIDEDISDLGNRKQLAQMEHKKRFIKQQLNKSDIKSRNSRLTKKSNWSIKSTVLIEGGLKNQQSIKSNYNYNLDDNYESDSSNDSWSAGG